jgi:hypothetical protein
MRRGHVTRVVGAVLAGLVLVGGFAIPVTGCRRAGGDEAAGPQPPGNAAPLVCVTELREHICDMEEFSAESPELVGPNGGLVLVGFGDVFVKVRVSAGAKDEDLLAAVAASPAATTFVAPDYGSGEPPSAKILTITWSGIAISSPVLPDPADLLAGAPGQPGYALEMTLTLDAAKAKALDPVAGPGGLYRLTVRRQRPPDWTGLCLDDPRVTSPFQAGAQLPGLAAGSYRFRLTFTKAMDRGSVEVALWRSGRATGFVWSDDRTVEFTVAVARQGGWLEPFVRLSPDGARDKEGMAVFLTGPLAFIWGERYQVTRVRPENPAQPEVVVPPSPPGVEPRAWSPDGRWLLGLASYRTLAHTGPEERGPYAAWVAWLYDAAAGTWSDLGDKVEPTHQATWLDGTRLFFARALSPGWQVLDVATGQVDSTVGPGRLRPWAVPETARPADQGATGDDQAPHLRVACFVEAGPPVSSSVTADLVVTDLAGRELGRLSGATIIRAQESVFELVPSAWLPDGSAFVFVDRTAAGTRLVRAGVAGDASAGVTVGPLTPVPGSERARRWRVGLFRVFGEAPVLGLAVLEDPPSSGAPPEENDDDLLGVFDLTAGAKLREIPVSIFDSEALPSADGRRVALVQRAGIAQGEPHQTSVLDLETGKAIGPGLPEGATAIGWSADGQWLYLVLSLGRE